MIINVIFHLLLSIIDVIKNKNKSDENKVQFLIIFIKQGKRI